MANRKRPSIRFAQNFLHNPALVKKIIALSNITREDFVYEIGPGKGIITDELAKNCKKLIAVEVDKNLSIRLKDKFKNVPNVKIINDNFLNFEIGRDKYKLFSNIPFNLTSEIIRKIIDFPLIDAYIIMQKEAAMKYTGNSLISILNNPWYEFKIIYKFSKYDFYPMPNVDIVLFNIKRKMPSSINHTDKSKYYDFITYCFNQRKSSVGISLKKIFSYKEIKRISSDLEFPLSSTPVMLDTAKWLGLFNRYLISNSSRKSIVLGSYKNLIQQQSKLRKR